MNERETELHMHKRDGEWTEPCAAAGETVVSFLRILPDGVEVSFRSRGDDLEIAARNLVIGQCNARILNAHEIEYCRFDLVLETVKECVRRVRS